MMLNGCTSTPLAGYLQALGVLRAVSRLLDERATGHWQRQRFVLDTSEHTSVDELCAALLDRFEPAAVVSPWNAGSGFAGNGKNTTAEAALRRVREATDPRLAILREAVLAGDAVVAEGRARGWGGKGDELWDKTRKPDVLALCRNRFPDAALSWLDAAVALGQDTDPAFSRLLGTGGNFGRQDLSATYLARVAQIFDDRRSGRWLRAALTGEESVPYLRDAVGQFDPGRAGGIQSSPWEKADDKGFVNPWSFVLTVEGALLFATAVVRRFGADNSRAALPFQVRGSTSGHDSAAPDEASLGELWAPEWTRPARLRDVEHLLAEGRAEWRGGPARSGLDFVRAVATLGVDRGIAAFERFVFVDRLGQNPLAVPAGRVEVRERGGVRLLAGLDNWFDAIRRATVPSLVGSRLRAVEQALYRHATSGAVEHLAEVFAAVGRCHEAVARSGAVRRVAAPLVLPNGPALLNALAPAADHDPDLRLALALVTARDEPAGAVATMHGLRPLLSPVTVARSVRWPVWLDAPAPNSLEAGLVTALAGAARRRALPGAVPETELESLEPAVRGVRIAFRRGCLLGLRDVQALLLDPDDHRSRVADLLAGLLTVDWRGCPDRKLGLDPSDRPPGVRSPDRPPGIGSPDRPPEVGSPDRLPEVGSPDRPPEVGSPDRSPARSRPDHPIGLRGGIRPLGPALDLLLPFTGTAPMRIPTESGSQPALLRPGTDWPLLLAADRVPEVLADASFRLRLAGVRHVIDAHGSAVPGARLATLLLLRTPDVERLAALRRVAALPRSTPKEASA